MENTTRWISGCPQPGARSLGTCIWALVVLGLTTWSLAPPALGKGPPDGKATQEMVTRSIPKDQIPLYSVVYEFFTMMGHFKTADPFIYEKRVRTMGLDPDGPTGRAFDAAVEAAQEVIAIPIADPSLADSPEKYEAFETEATREKSRRLADVYGGLLADLEARGFDPESFRTYLETKIRPSVGVFVEVPRDGDPVATLLGSSTMSAIRDFEVLAEAAYRSGATNLSEER